jgi:NAD-dependent dihydropyrimidine dehydrogenase PreA subunit
MKTKRRIIKIDERLCDGCGNCVTGCHEGALQVIDGKARLISDLLCDGLGACIGECPRGAIKIEEREAVPENSHEPRGYPGGRTMDFRKPRASESVENTAAASQLRQWPVQLHLVSPMAPCFRKADVVLAADCTAFAHGNFHNDFIKGKAVIIACPKLDDGQESYVEKIQALIEDARVNTLTVVTMEVPCCNGLLALVKTAAASRKVPVKHVVIGIQGGIKSETWA